MTNKNDWRLTNQMDYLFGKKLLHIHYEPYNVVYRLQAAQIKMGIFGVIV